MSFPGFGLVKPVARAAETTSGDLGASSRPGSSWTAACQLEKRVLFADLGDPVFKPRDVWFE